MAEREGYSRDATNLPPGETPVDSAVASGTEVDDGLFSEAWTLAKTRSIYTTSTDYRDTNIARQWERSLAHFRGEHAPGSRYKRDDWRRSRTFRPKTRANIKAQEAGFVAAAFSTTSVVEVQPQDPGNDPATVGAAVSKALMQYRLEYTMDWFLTALGAYQDTKVYGICASHTYWEYQKRKILTPAMNEDGTPVMGDSDELDEETGEFKQVPMAEETEEVIVDRPRVDVFEPENLRFDPMADWRNPTDTSPYLIRLWPMYVGDVLERMEAEDDKAWRKYNLAQILAARQQTADRIRQAREGRQRVDPTLNAAPGDEFTVVWAHFNIVRIKGVDYFWWTLGTELLLTDPVPLKDEYPWIRPGERPLRIGYSSVEAHRNYPAGDAEQMAPMQEEINDIVNQRLDNVSLVLNKRYFIRRGSQTDLEALMRNVPGGGVMVNDPEKDIKTVDTNDVTSSSYQEQDRLATELDELVGGFSQGSVMNNRKMNETVGGMERIASSAGAVQDYGLNIFIHTWYTPVLRQIQRLLAYYEDDATVLALAAKKAKAYPRYSLDRVQNELLTQELIVQVNVGVGNTDPVNRVNRLTQGIQIVATLPGMPERLKSVAVADDVFGALGFRDASRYFMDDDEFGAMKANLPPPPPPPEIEVKLKELEIRREDNMLRDEREREAQMQKLRLEFQKIAAAAGMKEHDLAVKLGIAGMQNKTQRETTALTEANKITEMNLQASQPPEEPQEQKGPPK